MKKLTAYGLILAGTFLANSSAFAMPNVGDDAVFAVAASSGIHSLTGTDEWTLVSFDASSGNYVERNTFTPNGNAAQAKDSTVAGKDLLDDATVNSVMARCGAYGGQLATISVPVGSFSTCALPLSSSAATALIHGARSPLAAGSNGTLWVAAGVAFGLVKIDSTDKNGVHIIYNMVSQKLGTP